jgi:S1-C subfamily serine protease
MRSIEEIVSRASAAVVGIETPTARGTGFFVKPDLLVTNAHVVESHGFVTVRLAGGDMTQGRVERSSADLDLAIVRATARPEKMQILQLGSGETVRAGQEVLAIGSPMGLQNTVTRGIVSAVRVAGGVRLIQTDAAINPGNSGGPLLDRDGRVIGINTLKMARGAESLGFAVAVSHAVPLIEGRYVASGSGTPQAPSLSGAFNGDTANSDSARKDGELQFERSLGALAERADQVDAQWKRLNDNCLLNPQTSDGQRAWFIVRDQSPSFKTGDAWCAGFLRDLRNYITQFSGAMAKASDEARRAGVYPGALREARRRHRLDWSGWDR